MWSQSSGQMSRIDVLRQIAKNMDLKTFDEEISKIAGLTDNERATLELIREEIINAANDAKEEVAKEEENMPEIEPLEPLQPIEPEQNVSLEDETINQELDRFLKEEQERIHREIQEELEEELNEIAQQEAARSMEIEPLEKLEPKTISVIENPDLDVELKLPEKINQVERNELSKQQTKLGKISTKFGIALNKVMVFTNKPFVNVSGFLHGFFDRKNKKNKSELMTELWLQNAIAWAHSQNKDELINLLEKIINGRRLKRREIKKLITAVPEVGFQETDIASIMATWGMGKYLLPKLILRAISKSLAKGVTAPLMLLDLSSVMAMVPCAFEKESTNINLIEYCETIKDHLIVQFSNSRIRGYLRGKNTRRKFEIFKKKRKAIRTARRERRQERKVEKERIKEEFIDKGEQ